MSTRHVHADLIHAWAEGAKIEYYTPQAGWKAVKAPSWKVNSAYRVVNPPKYRVGLYKYGGTVCVDSKEEEERVEDDSDFSRWLTDWVSYVP